MQRFFSKRQTQTKFLSLIFFFKQRKQIKFLSAKIWIFWNMLKNSKMNCVEKKIEMNDRIFLCDFSFISLFWKIRDFSILSILAKRHFRNFDSFRSLLNVWSNSMPKSKCTEQRYARACVEINRVYIKTFFVRFNHFFYHIF